MPAIVPWESKVYVNLCSHLLGVASCLQAYFFMFLTCTLLVRLSSCACIYLQEHCIASAMSSDLLGYEIKPCICDMRAQYNDTSSQYDLHCKCLIFYILWVNRTYSNWRLFTCIREVLTPKHITMLYNVFNLYLFCLNIGETAQGM